MASGGSKAFDVGRMAIGGIGQMLDGVDFVKRAWSSLSLPSTLVPTVDIDELDKRIADLKAVEQWLNVNLSMLHGTIQGLEIQRGTLAAVKAFGSTLGAAMPGRDGAAAQAPAPSAFDLLTTRAATPAAMPFAPPVPEPVAAPSPEPAPEPEPGVPARKGARKASARADAGEPTAGLPGMPGISPSAWWNLLQQNFNQVAAAALSGALPAGDGSAPAGKRGRRAPDDGAAAAPAGGARPAARRASGAKRGTATAGAAAKKTAAPRTRRAAAPPVQRRRPPT